MGLFHVKESRIVYSDQPADSRSYTNRMDKSYDLWAKFYDLFMFLFPLWKKWITSVLPFIEGDKILEVSFGPGFILKKCAGKYDCYGIDYNKTMVELVKRKLARRNLPATVLEANVEELPFEDSTFDSVINTMAFTGYPDGRKAIQEMIRVLKKNGKLLLVDFDYPENRNYWGFKMVQIMERGGDLIKNIDKILQDEKLVFRKKAIGGFGSAYLYVITR